MALHGWIIIDKPLGLSSTAVGSKLKRILKTKKIGHVGTLDPLASGVLACAVGEATKLIPYLSITQKTYQFHITFGESRSTDDAEGEVLSTTSVIPTQKDILDVFAQFKGEIEQVPPVYSAIHVNGKRSYTLARQGMASTLPSRKVIIYNLTLLSQISTNTYAFEVECGPGTYVRSLARDIALSLGSLGYVSFLRRIKDGCFLSDNAIPLEKIEEMNHNNYLQSLSSVLDDIPAVTVSDVELEKILKGQFVSTHSFDVPCIQIRFGEHLRGIGKIEQGLIKPKRILIKGENDVDFR